jgi:hypothetical protein
MAFGANISRVMIVDIDLVEPFRTRGALLMAPHTQSHIELGQFVGGILHMAPAGAVASFARKPVMLAFGQLLDVVRMAFDTGCLAGPKWLARRDLLQGVPPVMPVFPKGRGRQEIVRRKIAAHNSNGQQHQADELRRQFEEWRHGILLSFVGVSSGFCFLFRLHTQIIAAAGRFSFA